MTDSHDSRVDHQGLLRNAMADTGRSDPRRPAPPSPEELAPLFPDHQILGLIGRGGMGAVYKAVQRRLDRLVAIKVLPREFAADPEFGERFLREAKALASLNHPHILTVHDFGSVDGIYYLVTEFVDGVNLRQLMELGQLSPAEALRITPQICTALQFAHEHGVVHRDVKPENILIDTSGQVKIADFGLAKLSTTNDPIALTRSTAVFGTPHYMAPEQWRGSGTVDHRADIFSLGVVLYEMLTGQLPLGHYDPPSQRTGVPRGLDQVVQRTLAQRPENRYQSAREVQTDVESEARHLGSPPPAPPKPRPAATKATGSRMSALPIVALVLLLVAGLGGGLITMSLVRTTAARQMMAEAQHHEARARAARIEAGLDAPAPGPGGTQASYDPTIDAPPVMAFAPLLIILAFGLPLLITSLLGFWSIARIRASDGSLHGMGLAVFVAWLLPLLVIDALLLTPIANIRNDDLQAVATFVGVLLLLVGNIAFLVWQTRRQTALAQTPARGSGGGLTVAIALLVLLGMGGCAAAFVFVGAPQAVVTKGGAQPTEPQLASELVGMSVEALLDQLGPPESITVSADMALWTYRDPRGVLIEHALSVVDDRVVAYSNDAAVLAPSGLPRTTPYVGQELGEVVVELGPPVDTAQGSIATSMTFANGLQLGVKHGRIFAIDRTDERR